jgi:hypothetical protein
VSAFPEKVIQVKIASHQFINNFKITIDFCGSEILNVTDPIKRIAAFCAHPKPSAMIQLSPIGMIIVFVHFYTFSHSQRQVLMSLVKRPLFPCG